jgi:uncharacterized protein (DUF4415 family)
MISLDGKVFTWRERKNKENRRKHGLSLEEAAPIFLDPFLVILYDDDRSVPELKRLPPLSKKRIAQIKAFKNTDFSDNPEWSAEDWKKARPAYTKIPKTDIHTKIDNDVLDWLKSDGKGYQARLNAALRFAMNSGF